MSADPAMSGERIAKVIARSGVCSRRDAEALIAAGKVTVNGKRIASPALNVTGRDVITVAGNRLQEREQPRLWLYHKPAGLVTSHKDDKDRPTVFASLPRDMPRVVSVGRLDLNTEGLLLLTNDGEIARHLELPANGWRRRYRARIYGGFTPELAEKLMRGVTVEGVKYGPVEVKPEKTDSKTRNFWAMVTLTEGKNREIRKALDHVDCRVSRLIRVAYGPFQLGSLPPGEVREVPGKIWREQLGGKWAKKAEKP